MFSREMIIGAVIISYVDNILMMKKVAYLGRVKGMVYIGIHTQLKQECSAFIADGEDVVFKSIILDQIYRRLKRYEQAT